MGQGTECTVQFRYNTSRLAVQRRTMGQGTECTVAGPAVLYTVYGQPRTALLSKLRYSTVPPSGAGHAATSVSRIWSVGRADTSSALVPYVRNCSERYRETTGDR